MGLLNTLFNKIILQFLAYIFDSRDLEWGMEKLVHWRCQNRGSGEQIPPPHSMVLKDSLRVFSVLDFKKVTLQILQQLSFHGK